MTEWLQHIDRMAPGIFGSLGAMMWIQGSWKRKLGLFAFGGVLAWYASGWLSVVTGIPEGFSGLLLGMFGMSIVDSLFRGWEALNLSALLREYVRQKLGLPRE